MYVLYTKQPPNVRVITIATVELSFNASDICLIISDEGVVLVLFGKLFNVTPFSVYKIKIQ